MPPLIKMIWTVIRNTMLTVVISVTLMGLWLGIQILQFPTTITQGSYDCAIVLGAAVIDEQPSPVFKARLDHGIDLYHQSIVKQLIVTGGVGENDRLAEGEVGAAYAQSRGVPAADTLIEKTSKSTIQNQQEAKALMDSEGIHTALIISDPLHLRRSLTIATWLGIEADASATPFSRYRSWKTKLPFLLREIYFTVRFWIVQLHCLVNEDCLRSL